MAAEEVDNIDGDHVQRGSAFGILRQRVCAAGQQQFGDLARTLVSGDMQRRATFGVGNVHQCAVLQKHPGGFDVVIQGGIEQRNRFGHRR